MLRNEDHCPHVGIMHLTADAFQLALGSAESGTDQHGRPMSWPVARTQLDTAMRRLDNSIANGAPHFPEAVRMYLTTTQLDLRQGRTQLAGSRDAQDMTSRTQTLLDDGKTAYGNASDLVGQQCDVPLRADTSTGWFTAATTPTSPELHNAPPPTRAIDTGAVGLQRALRRHATGSGRGGVGLDRARTITGMTPERKRRPDPRDAARRSSPEIRDERAALRAKKPESLLRTLLRSQPRRSNSAPG